MISVVSCHSLNLHILLLDFLIMDCSIFVLTDKIFCPQYLAVWFERNQLNLIVIAVLMGN